jgi:hypothetical protein
LAASVKLGFPLYFLGGGLEGFPGACFGLFGIDIDILLFAFDTDQFFVYDMQEPVFFPAALADHFFLFAIFSALSHFLSRLMSFLTRLDIFLSRERFTALIALSIYFSWCLL